MLSETLPLSAVEYRNFNLCPHCERIGADPLLIRLAESLPMISRSDGEKFHLLLADRPLPYPAERKLGPARHMSLCFWYSSCWNQSLTQSTLVLTPVPPGNALVPYREVELVADLLSDKLFLENKLASLYAFSANSLQPLNY